ncbi:MAG: hypothetical protein JW946_01295, partial [Candidatus Omnitrophica bacterium]|nr:hypothetical protein [Candidatus Omnitrophota bacterium]
KSRVGVAHNNFVQNSAEMGFVGSFIYVALMYLSFKALYVVQKLKPNNIKKDFAILPVLARALLVSIVGFVIVTSFITMELDILFIWIGLCAVVLNIAQQEIENIRFKFAIKDIVVIFIIIIIHLIGLHIITVTDII